MAPKTAKAAKAASPPAATELIPFNGNSEDRGALLPYLALGFIPLSTTGGAHMCGLHALRGSYNAARRALRPAGAPAIADISANQFTQWFNSDEYSAEVEAEMLVIGSDRADLEAVDNLSLNQLRLILRVSNNSQGTNFRLGVITEGYRGKRGDNGGAYDHGFVAPHLAHVVDNTSRGPVIWIWNDNGEMQGLHQRGNTKSVAHWEAFGPGPATGSRARRQRVQNWGLGQEMLDDLKAGVWMLTQDCAGDNEDELAAWQGEFVRESAPRDVVGANLEIPDAHRFVVTCFGRDAGNEATLDDDDFNNHFGIIEEESLQEIELSDDAPTAPKEGDGVAVSGGGHGNDKGKDEAGKGNREGKRTFRIFRTIEPTNKMGNPLDQKDLENRFIGGFEFDGGEFLLDSTQRVNGHAVVTDIEGAEGEVQFRCLQYLENPWGLPDDMEVPTNTFTLDIKEKASVIRAEAKKRGLKSEGGNKKEIYDLIVEHEEDQTTQIPMYRLTRDFDANRANSIVPFKEDEVVFRSTRRTQGKADLYRVRDFEGTEAAIPRRFMESIFMPWGFRITKEQRGILEKARGPKTPQTFKKRGRDDDSSDSDSDNAPPPPKKMKTLGGKETATKA